MSQHEQHVTPRREFIKSTVKIAAASALAGVAIPRVFAAEDNTIQLALIGCGGRGSGAVANAMSAGGLVLGGGEGGPAAGGPVKLVAMADLLPSQVERSHKALTEILGDKIDVPKERQFIGFDAYRKAIDCLRPGDVAMLTTHAGFRAVHLDYAVEKGVNVFMEKDFAADPGGVQKILRAGEAAEKKNLKIAAGVMARHSSARQAMIQQIRDGAMGDIQLIRAYRMDSGYLMGPVPRGENELLWQLSPGHPYQFLWSSGGIFIELMIHQIDECFWIKDAWPVSAHGVGGRFAGSTDCSQNLDSYSIEYTFADGTKALVTGRYIPELLQRFRHVCPWDKVCRTVLRQTSTHRRPRSTRTSASIPTTSPGNRRRRRSIRGRPSGTCSWTRSATTSRTTRPARGTVESGCDHGSSGRPHRTDHHLGAGHGLDVRVLPECGRTDGEQSGTGPVRRARSLSRTHSRHRLDGDLRKGGRR